MKMRLLPSLDFQIFPLNLIVLQTSATYNKNDHFIVLPVNEETQALVNPR